MNCSNLFLVVVLVFLLLPVPSASFVTAQSKDKNNPTRLTTTEISGVADGKNNPSLAGHFYYTFMAGPGELSIDLEVQAEKPSGSTGIAVGFTLEGDDAKPINLLAGDKSIPGALLHSTSSTKKESGTLKAVIPRRQKVVLHIYINPDIALGRYRLQLSGAVGFSPTSLAVAQSKDKNNPTPLTSPEISGSADPKAPDNYYYSFTAGPGELVITVTFDVEPANLRKLGFMLGLCLQGEDGRDIPFYASTPDRTAQCLGFIGDKKQSVVRAMVSRKQTVLLSLKTGDEGGSSGSYRVQLSGAVEFSKPASSVPNPSRSSGSVAQGEVTKSNASAPTSRRLDETLWKGTASQEAYRQALVRRNAAYPQQHFLGDYDVIFKFDLGGKLTGVTANTLTVYTSTPVVGEVRTGQGILQVGPCSFVGEWRQQGDHVHMKIAVPPNSCPAIAHGVIAGERNSVFIGGDEIRKDVMDGLRRSSGQFIYNYTQAPSKQLSSAKGYWNLIRFTEPDKVGSFGWVVAERTIENQPSEPLLITDVTGANCILSDGQSMRDGAIYLLEGTVSGNYITGETYAVKWFGNWNVEYDANKQRWLVVTRVWTKNGKCEPFCA